jgi:hypothetical protein
MPCFSVTVVQKWCPIVLFEIGGGTMTEDERVFMALPFSETMAHNGKANM